jgi:hypothetical protein
VPKQVDPGQEFRVTGLECSLQLFGRSWIEAVTDGHTVLGIDRMTEREGNPRAATVAGGCGAGEARNAGLPMRSLVQSLATGVLIFGNDGPPNSFLARSCLTPS